jgi:hypothetical protein
VVDRAEPMVYVAIALYRLYMGLSKEEKLKHSVSNSQAQALLT